MLLLLEFLQLNRDALGISKCLGLGAGCARKLPLVRRDTGVTGTWAEKLTTLAHFEQLMIHTWGTLLRSVAQQSWGVERKSLLLPCTGNSGKFTETAFSRLTAMAHHYRGSEIRDKMGKELYWVKLESFFHAHHGLESHSISVGGRKLGGRWRGRLVREQFTGIRVAGVACWPMARTCCGEVLMYRLGWSMV